MKPDHLYPQLQSMCSAYRRARKHNDYSTMRLAREAIRALYRLYRLQEIHRARQLAEGRLAEVCDQKGAQQCN